MKYFTYFIMLEPKIDWSGGLIKKIIALGSYIFMGIIKWYQYGSPYIHAGIVLNFEEPDFIRTWPKVFQACADGMKVGWMIGNFRYFQVPITPAQSDMIQNEINKYLNEGYDYRGLLSFIFRMKTTESKKFYCSELVMAVAKDIGVQLFAKDCQPYMVYPSMLSFSTIAKEV